MLWKRAEPPLDHLTEYDHREILSLSYPRLLLGFSGLGRRGRRLLKCRVFNGRALGFWLSPLFDQDAQIFALSPLFDEDAQIFCCYAPPFRLLCLRMIVWLLPVGHGKAAWPTPGKCLGISVLGTEEVLFLFATVLDPLWGGKVLGS
jgi:hypothetical protein